MTWDLTAISAGASLALALLFGVAMKTAQWWITRREMRQHKSSPRQPVYPAIYGDTGVSLYIGPRREE